MGDEDDLDAPSDEPKWESEYKEGLDHEIYRCALSPKLENKYFSEVVRLIYKQQKAIVFAIEVKCNNKTIIRLNPSDFIVNNIDDNQIHVYCICPDGSMAEGIETYDMSQEEINKYWTAKQ